MSIFAFLKKEREKRKHLQQFPKGLKVHYCVKAKPISQKVFFIVDWISLMRTETGVTDWRRSTGLSGHMNILIQSQHRHHSEHKLFQPLSGVHTYNDFIYYLLLTIYVFSCCTIKSPVSINSTGCIYWVHCIYCMHHIMQHK